MPARFAVGGFVSLREDWEEEKGEEGEEEEGGCGLRKGHAHEKKTGLRDRDKLA